MEEIIESEGLKRLGITLDFPNYREVIFEEGKEEGIEKGIEEGIERGIERGIEKGKFEIIRNLLDLVDVNILSQRTGISIDTLNNLKKSEDL
jgi:predicted transposase/invertase (TIGR01784 family)